MNKTLKLVLIVIGSLVLVCGSFYAGWALADRTEPAVVTLAVGRGYGPGKMGGRMMDGGRGSGRAGSTTPLTAARAEEAAQQYLDRLGLPDLKIAEVMIFDNGAYVRVVEQSTGIGAFELLVDPQTMAVYPEHGPNMKWNLKYDSLNHQGMMGGSGGSAAPVDVPADMPVDAAQALAYAQTYLDSYMPGALVAMDADPFYGYYTIDILRDGKIIGMLSVNGTSGQVFYHTWHGNFIEVSEE